MSEAHVSDVTRRDFLYIATGAAGVVAVGGVAWPLVSQLGPNEEVQAAGEPVEIDVSSVEPGMQLIIVWRGMPYFIRRLTEPEIKSALDAPKDNFIDFAEAKDRIAESEWTIVSASCTHLGCVPTKVDLGLEGWFCACHGSKFDVIGRVMKGPAPINLPLPPFNFATAEKLVIGLEKKKKEA